MEWWEIGMIIYIGLLFCTGIGCLIGHCIKGKGFIGWPWDYTE